MKRLVPIAVAAVLGVSVLAGCGSSGDTHSSTSTKPSSSRTASPSSTPKASASLMGAMTITVNHFRYTDTGSVKPGAMVMVKNDDSEAHTVTADQGGFSVKVAPGGTAMLTAPSKPGTYAYHCTYHADMHGMLKVG